MVVSPLARAWRVAIVAAVCSALCQWAEADFTRIDDFEGYAAGTAIDGQGDWLAESNSPTAAGVSTDPLDPTNRVLNIGDGGFTSGRLGHRETINTSPALRIAQGSTATLFFRILWESADVDLSIGMTDVANPISDVIFNSFTQFESQLAVSFSPGNDRLGIRDATGLKVLTTDVQPLAWYNVWMVIDNAAETTQVYLQGGAFASPTLLSNAGNTSFLFRNGVAENDLITLFIATGRNTSNLPPNPIENIGPVYIDDIYIDTTGVNLTNPVPEPSGLVLAATGVVALMAVRRRGRARRCRAA